MRRNAIFTVLSVFALSWVALAQQSDPIQAAATALGASGIKTLQITASGRNFSVGQNATPTEAWPAVTVKSWVGNINYDTAGMRVEIVREMGAVMPRGGGAPFFGEQRQIQLVSGEDAWNMPPAAPGATPGAAQPQPGAAAERMLALWSTPVGFLKAAAANKATSKKAAGGTEVSFTVAGKYKMVGTLNAQNQVARVQTWIDNPVLGDMLVDTTYTGYKDFGGVQFPATIKQSQGGFPALELTVSAVQANAPAEITLPPNVHGAQPPAVKVDSTKVADGVFFLTGGSHHSVVIEMKDHVVIVEGPLNEERSLAVMAKAKELVPSKPIRFVINTHHHWDHSGGLRPFVDAGVTVVTHQMNRPFYEKSWAAPRTLGPDRLSSSKKKPVFQTFTEDGKLTDGTRTIELHRLTGYGHTDDMLVVYLPKEKILIEADAFTPLPATAKLVPPSIPAAQTLAGNIERLKLDVTTIVPLHGNGTTTVADVTSTIARSSAN